MSSGDPLILGSKGQRSAWVKRTADIISERKHLLSAGVGGRGGRCVNHARTRVDSERAHAVDIIAVI